MTFIIIATLHLGVGVGVDQAPARMGNLKKNLMQALVQNVSFCICC